MKTKKVDTLLLRGARGRQPPLLRVLVSVGMVAILAFLAPSTSPRAAFGTRMRPDDGKHFRAFIPFGEQHNPSPAQDGKLTIAEKIAAGIVAIALLPFLVDAIIGYVSQRRIRDMLRSAGEGGQMDLLFVGNPGVGKSTLLSGISGQGFVSGVSYGRGLTTKFEFKTIPGVENVRFMDTPGLADVSLKHTAAAEIEKALNASRDAKEVRLFFVVTLEAGRVRPMDIITIDNVLDAVTLTHDMTKSDTFGVIVNQCDFGPRFEAEGKAVLREIFSSGEFMKYPTRQVLYLPRFGRLPFRALAQTRYLPGLVEGILEFPGVKVASVDKVVAMEKQVLENKIKELEEAYTNLNTRMRQEQEKLLNQTEQKLAAERSHQNDLLKKLAQANDGIKRSEEQMQQLAERGMQDRAEAQRLQEQLEEANQRALKQDKQVQQLAEKAEQDRIEAQRQSEQWEARLSQANQKALKQDEHFQQLAAKAEQDRIEAQRLAEQWEARLSQAGERALKQDRDVQRLQKQLKDLQQKNDELGKEHSHREAELWKQNREKAVLVQELRELRNLGFRRSRFHHRNSDLLVSYGDD